MRKGAPAGPVDAVTARLTAPGQLFEMEEREVRGVPMRTWRHAPRTLGAVLERTRGYGADEFVVFEGTRWTYAEHYRRASAVAWRLAESLGVRPGDRVAIAMRNLPEWIAVFWGAVAAGAVAVPLNAWWTGTELAYALADSGAVVAFADADRAARLRPHLRRLGGLRAVVVVDEPGPAVDGEAAASPGAGRGAGVAFAEFLGDAAEAEAEVETPPGAVHPDDNATIFYTSGTTGRPKGVVGTHRNACTSIMTLHFLNMRARALRTDDEGPAEAAQRSCLLTVPLFHTTGCQAVLIPVTAGGGKVVLMRQFAAEPALDIIERERISIVVGVPTVVQRILDSPDLGSRDVSSVRTVAMGGAPAPAGLAARIRSAFTVGLPGNGYGLTETSAVTAQISGEDYLRRPDSVGRPIPVADVAVVPPGFDGDEPPPSAPGAVGELWVRGPHVVRGYWNEPEETERVLRDGWLRTGDLAAIDADGFISVVDRLKDMIIRGGENVYCPEVEEALFTHPAVAECAVVGVPHPDLGEEVAAVVVLHVGAAAGAGTLTAHASERLSHFKVPTRYWIRTEPLPRNASGKVDKSELRARLAGGATP